jgi:hypothetical protein
MKHILTEMMTVSAVSELINSGVNLYLAASEELLTQLPKGNWIGGTIPYFMTANGGLITHEKIHVTQLPSNVVRTQICQYSESTLNEIPKNYLPNGLSLIVLPAFSNVHLKYAKECTTWSGIFNQPIVGWITGTDLSNSTEIPKVINGKTGELLTDQALVMHTELSNDVMVTANIINIFEQSEGDTIEFQTTGFDAEMATVNGKEVNLADYLLKNKIDLRQPLVADYLGAMINVSFRDLDSVSQKVRFYAPVFPGVKYKLAKSFGNYEQEFENALKRHQLDQPIFACNCILNFLYGNLEGKKSGHVICAMTFGEIAYMLLNQTFVYVTISKV